MMPDPSFGGGEATRRAEAAFLTFLQEERMEERLARGVLLAFSGGGDSVLLFHLLAAYTKERGIPFAAVHIHHGLRGEEAERDAAFCRAFSEERGVPFFLISVDVPQYLAGDGRGMGTEAAARTLRYAALDDLLASHPEYAVCATAHHATDNLETVLLHLLRGSGLRGMAGIPPVRGAYVRPLLSLTRGEIMEALGELSLSYVTDSTNEALDYDRNYIRREILPRLSQLRPEPERAVTRLSSNLREEWVLGEELCDRFFAEKVRAGRVPRASFLLLPAALRARVIARLCRMAGASVMPERVHTSAISRLLEGDATSGSFDLPGNAALLYDKEGFSVFLHADIVKRSYRIPLALGENLLPDGAGLLFLSEGPDPVFQEESANVYNLFIQARIPFATICDELFVRTLEDGDSYRSGGMTRRVRRQLSSLHLSPDLRAGYPLLCDANGILWVPGFGVRDGEKSTENENSRAIYAYFCYGRKE